MLLKLNKFIFVFLFLFIGLRAIDCPSQPAQIYLDSASDGVCNLPLEIVVYSLNYKGDIDKEFAGLKKVNIDVKEIGGSKKGSYKIFAKELSFILGRSVFIVSDSEEERLAITIAVESIKNKGTIEVPFVYKDFTPPNVTEVVVEKANIIIINFSEEVSQEYSTDTNNYTAVTSAREVAPKSVEYRRDNVLLEFSDDFGVDETGVIEIQELADLNGNEIPSAIETPEFTGDCGCY